VAFSRRHVDPVILDNLHRLDPHLEPRWNIDKERWEIYRDGKHIMVVQSINGGYQPLDNRTLQKLFIADTHRYKNEFEFIRQLHMEDEKLSKMKIKEQDEFVRACYRDMAPFLRGRKSVTAKVQDA
jgi:hypothetical protein